jgi:O-antigen/teichoic acid export membrane protein
MVAVKKISYIPILSISMGLMFARTLVLAKILDIELFGEFSIGMLVSNSFCMFSCFGFYQLLQRDQPVLINQGRNTRAFILVNQALLMGCLVFLLGFFLSLLDIFEIPQVFFMLGLLNGFAQQQFLVVTQNSRSYGRTFEFAIENLYRSISTITIVSLVALNYQSAELILLSESIITLLISTFIYLKSISLSKVRPIRTWIITIKTLKKYNFTTPTILLVTSLIGFIISNGDRWIASSTQNKELFALYSFAGLILIIAQSAQAIINASLFPLLSKTHTIEGTFKTIKTTFIFSITTMILLSIAAIPGYLLIEFIINTWYQQYIKSLPIISLFIPIAILRTSDFWTSFLLITKKERKVLKINLFTLLAFSLFTTYLYYNGIEPNPADLAQFSLALNISLYIFTIIACFNAPKIND